MKSNPFIKPLQDEPQDAARRASDSLGATIERTQRSLDASTAKLQLTRLAIAADQIHDVQTAAERAELIRQIRNLCDEVWQTIGEVAR